MTYRRKQQSSTSQPKDTWVEVQKLQDRLKIPYSAHRCEAEIDNYIQANRHSWD